MSTFKKVISIVLCISMLAGSFAMLGGLTAPEASAAEGTSNIDSYASLDEAYDKFVYFGIDWYELDITVNADGTYSNPMNHALTDHYVDAGQILEARLYIKSDMYMGNGTFITAYDNDFFDVTRLEATAALTSNGYTTGATGVVNTNHPVYVSNGIKNTLTSNACSAVAWFTNRTDYTDEELASWDFSQSLLSFTDNGKNYAYRFTSDEWAYSWYVKVRDDVKEGDTGVTETKAQFWKCDAKTAAATNSTWNGRQAYFSILPRESSATDTTTLVSATKNCYQGYTTFNKFLYEDMSHTFTCGKNSEGGESTGPVEGTSVIDSYASLDEAYDKFVYFGIDWYELDITVNADGTYSNPANHTLTDHYVDAGQILEARLYIKSDMYMGNGTFITAYDNDFFDVTRLEATAALTSNGYTTGATGVVNTAHPVYISNGIKNTLTSNACSDVAWFTNRTDYTDAELASWDFSQSLLSFTDNGKNYAYRFTSDEWAYSWYVKVRDDVKEGDTGVTETKAQFWKCDAKTAAATNSTWNGRQAYFSILPRESSATDTTTLVSATKNCYQGYTTFNKFLYEDMSHTFTCGKNSAGGSAVAKYTVKFVENDGTEISAKEYTKGAEVEVPAAIDGQYGWANTASGAIEKDLTGYTAITNVEYKRVLDTDKFDVTINLGAGATVDESELPDDATLDGTTLKLKATVGEVIDLSKLPAPEKTGYVGAYNPARVTVDNIKGATASVTWTAKTYTVNFYENKGDAEPISTQTVAYNATASYRATAPKGYKFGAWVDAATDDVVSTNAGFKYTYDEDKDFYAQWTEFDSSFTLMVRDYTTADGWKAGAVAYNDSGKTFSTSEIVALAEEAAANVGADVAYLTGTKIPFIYTDSSLSTSISAASNWTYSGDAVYYLSTCFDFEITWKVPVFDETTGEFNGFTEATSTATTAYNENSVYAKMPADVDTTAPAGYTFNGWKNEATDEFVAYNSNLGIKLVYADSKEFTFVADFTETEYTIIFNVQNGIADGKLTLNDTLKVGETINLDEATFTNGFDKEAFLPEIGVENSQQVTKFIDKDGYKFTGWTLGTGADSDKVEFPAEITYELIDEYASGTTITIYGQWEAEEYELKFYYVDSGADLSKDYADRDYEEPIVVKYKTGDTINKNVDDETLEMIKSKAPEGYGFYQWRTLSGDLIPNRMPAFGLELYAVYAKNKISIYVDYNNPNRVDEEGNKLPLSETMKETPLTKNKPVYVGDDIEAIEDVEAGIEMGVGTLVKRQMVTGGDNPGDDYVIVSWNVYHVPAGKDVFDTANWVSGINDEGTSNAYTTVIYQPEWKQFRDFLFRVYDTNGKLCFALGKNLKTYYWFNHYVCERGQSPVNKDPENLVIFFYIPELENWDWNGFFKAEMWSSLALRFDPFDVPKSALTIESFIALMGALGDLIKNLL